MANSEDTEITLGTGKMLAIFFGLVALCAVFFGMGFSLGKTSAAPSGAGVTSVNSSASSTRPAAMKPSGSAASPDLSFYKTVGQKEPDTQLSAADTGAAQASPPSAPDLAAQPPGLERWAGSLAQRRCPRLRAGWQVVFVRLSCSKAGRG